MNVRESDPDADADLPALVDQAPGRLEAGLPVGHSNPTQPRTDTTSPRHLARRVEGHEASGRVADRRAPLSLFVLVEGYGSGPAVGVFVRLRARTLPQGVGLVWQWNSAGSVGGATDLQRCSRSILVAVRFCGGQSEADRR
ncbi:hypothetical protein [Parafrankia discariae]|uniref:hypothetical protein n=1 Tax=Parafrankia discariae TaxID=365528 RepID=UPI0012B6AC65|nr:hypothetical protein [Parafrankia discariae]